MNMVCYINKLSLGGAERVMSILANGLSARGHQVALVTDYRMDNEYPLSDKVRRFNLDGRFEGASRGRAVIRTARRVAALRRICREQRADIIVSFIFEANLRALLATRFSRVKNLISVRVDPRSAYGRKSLGMLAKLCYRLAEGCVFQTEEAIRWYPQSIQKRARIIVNPVAEAFYAPREAGEREKRVVTCGRLSKQKNQELLIRAFARIHQEHPAYQLEIYGVGALREQLARLIAELGLQGAAFLRGHCQDVPKAIGDAGLFVLTSDFEGLPNALMEAMALGLPVISTDCGGGGARMLIEHGENGLLIPCGDEEALVVAMARMIDEPAWAETMAEKARESAAGYAESRVIAAWEAYIRDLCGDG